METRTLTKKKEKTHAFTTVEIEIRSKRKGFSFSGHEKAFDSARFGWMAIMLAFQSCLGAVACLYISKHESDIFLLSTCAAVTMGSNAIFIALAPARYCLIGFYLSVLINSVIILYYF